MSWSRLGVLLRGRRAERGYDEDRLAVETGIPADRIREVESDGRARLSDVEAQALWTVLGYDPRLRGCFDEDRVPPVSVSSLLSPSLSKPAKDVQHAFEGTVRAGKTSSAYRAHSYHTKCPPEAIERLITHYTSPGAVVVDSFCGSGMTGVAALRAGRSGILSDLSPAAVHIASNYTTPCDPAALTEAAGRVANHVDGLIRSLYGLKGGDLVEYTTWSDVFACPDCGTKIVYWEGARDELGAITDQCRCRRCRQSFDKRALRWVGEVPVETNTSGLRGRSNHTPTPEELRLIERSDGDPIDAWFPDVPFGATREMWRAGHAAAGVTSVAEFFTRRNLRALAAVRASIMQENDERLRSALMFAFTACVNRASKRYQWNAKRPTNVMTGTLYISSLRYEWNVWSLFWRKLRDVVRYYENLGAPSGRCAVVQSSATDLQHLPDGVAGFVFLDPPFGSNIFYADSSLLWDAWLGCMTDERDEIVVNKHRRPNQGGKSLDDYQRLMTAALCEVVRTLRPGAWATLQFNNTDSEIWVALQDAVADAGLAIEGASGLDKIQPSIKGVKGNQDKENVAQQDALIAMRKAPRRQMVSSKTSLPDLVSTLVTRNDRAISTDEIYAEVVRGFLSQGISLAGISMSAVKAALAATCTWTSRGWTVKSTESTSTAEAATTTSYRPVVSPFGCVPAARVASTADIEALLRPDEPAPVVHGEAPRSVPGRRNTALYTAHSYHTKVPPEAITPYILHFTRPGDVVLDLFSGSGMTGVAAVLTGRRAILNDLSVVGAHLAYNHTRPCDPAALTETFARLYEKVHPAFSRLYKTEDDAGIGYVHYTLWSRDAVCPSCSERTSLWDVIDRKTGRMSSEFVCPKCKKASSKQALKYDGNRPVLVSYKSAQGRRMEQNVTKRDLAHVEWVEGLKIEDWYPDVEIEADREMYIRSALHLQHVTCVADMYTKRNLAALSLLWAEVNAVVDDRVRAALQFAFTNTAWHGTRMRRFNARGGQRPLTGTLYVPQLSSEANVLEVMKHKVKQLRAFYEALRPSDPSLPPPAIRIGSATQLDGIPDASVDYCYLDPPFGSNLFYADCNLVWEAWLGGLTRVEHEAVVNRSLPPERGGKTLHDYERLMAGSLREMHRVLKPGAWATLVFHNTDPEVWRALQRAALDAGFRLAEAGELDRQQQSHKGYKGRADEEAVAHFDVVMSMQKAGSTNRGVGVVSLAEARRLIRDVAIKLPDRDRTVQRVHSGVIQSLLRDGLDVGSVTFEMVREELGAVDDGRTKPTQRSLPL